MKSEKSKGKGVEGSFFCFLDTKLLASSCIHCQKKVYIWQPDINDLSASSTNQDGKYA